MTAVGHIWKRGPKTGRRASACRFRLAVAAVLSVHALGTVPAVSAPYLPTDDAQPLERLPTAGNATARELRRLHAELTQKPEDLRLALRVANRDIETARAESDPRYNGYAEAALAPWLRLADPPIDVLVLRATLRQSAHDFAPALADLTRVISIEPSNAQAWLTRAVILQVEGDYPKALANCLSLARLTEPLVAAICTDGVAGLSGRAAASYDDLSQALDRAPSGESPQIRLWALTVLAESAARRGDSAAAERNFKTALSLGVRDGYLLGAYADFLLDENRPEDVRALLESETRIDPLLLRLALAEQRAGGATLTRHVDDLTERFAAARARGDTVHRREEARYALDLLRRPQQALALAEANWAVQREPWDARLVLEAAAAAGMPAAARPVLDWLATTKLEDIHLSRLAAQFQKPAR